MQASVSAAMHRVEATNLRILDLRFSVALFSIEGSCFAFSLLEYCTVYQFYCSCDASLTYVDMSTCHLSNSVGEYLGFHLKTKKIVKNILCLETFVPKLNVLFDYF